VLEHLERISEGDCAGAVFVALHEHLPEHYKLKAQVKLLRGFGGSSRGARLDLAIMDERDGHFALIIETKRSPGSTATAQGERYGRMAGARVLYLRGLKACQGCLPAVLSALPPG